MRFSWVLAVLFLTTCNTVLTAQQSGTPPATQPDGAQQGYGLPQAQPVAPANTEILRLLQGAMSETVVLTKIRSLAGQFDTTTDALLALKQAGATEAELIAILSPDGLPQNGYGANGQASPQGNYAEQNNNPQQPPQQQANNGPSLEATLKYVAEKTNAVGRIDYVSSPLERRLSICPLFEANCVRGGLETGNVHGDAAQCTLTFDSMQASAAFKRAKAPATHVVFELKNITKVSSGQYQPPWRGWGTVPDIYVVTIQATGGGFTFYYLDNDTPGHVANAMDHAAESCGANIQRDPF